MSSEHRLEITTTYWLWDSYWKRLQRARGDKVEWSRWEKQLEQALFTISSTNLGAALIFSRNFRCYRPNVACRICASESFSYVVCPDVLPLKDDVIKP